MSKDVTFNQGSVFHDFGTERTLALTALKKNWLNNHLKQ
jgi:hypothetical protein